MIGPRAADAVLVLGAREPSIRGGNRHRDRLNGRTVVVGDSAAAETAIDRAAEEAGRPARIHHPRRVDALPFDRDTFHIVVTPELADWPADGARTRLAEAVRVLQPGGRVDRDDRRHRRRPDGPPHAHGPTLDTETVLGSCSGAACSRRGGSRKRKALRTTREEKHETDVSNETT